MILILQLRLRALAPTPNSLRIIAIKRSTGLGMVQTGPILIIPRNQQRDAKRPAHDGLLPLGGLAEAQGQVADGLRAALDAQVLVVVEGVALALDARVLDHAARISLQPGHGTADVTVDFDDLLDRGGFEERGGHALLDAEDYALRSGDANGGAAKFDGFEGVFDLEEPTFGGEGAAKREDGSVLAFWLDGVETVVVEVVEKVEREKAYLMPRSMVNLS